MKKSYIIEKQAHSLGWDNKKELENDKKAILKQFKDAFEIAIQKVDRKKYETLDVHFKFWVG